MNAIEPPSLISVIFSMAHAANDLVPVDGGFVPMSAATYFNSKPEITTEKAQNDREQE